MATQSEAKRDCLRANRNETTKADTASPIAFGLSSWTKWTPGTVTSVWLGQVRQNSRGRPVRMAPGSALIKSLGIGLFAMKSA